MTIAPPPTITKQRLSREVGRRTGLTNKQASVTVEAVITILTEQIAAGGRVELSNFLTLEVQQRIRIATEQTFGYNSRLSTDTSQPYFVLRCKPGKQLRVKLRALAAKS